ncbi:MAG: hypothetical protein FJ314_07370 [SAR202 cluster bacterium]|nr:hypothetical protein [SAR202 cluster bacterium]
MTQKAQAMPEPSGATGGQSVSGRAEPRYTPPELAALEHARADRKPYGRWAKRNLEFSVAGSEHAGEVVRVRVTYRPAGNFRGRPGEEVVSVRSDGSFVEREVVHRPQESFPWVLAVLAAVSAIAAIVLIPLIIIDPRPGDPLYVSGRFLWMRVSNPLIAPAVHFQNQDISGSLSNFAISQPDASTQLAVIQVTLINQQSAEVVVVVDGKAAEVTTVNGLTVFPINTVERSANVQSLDARFVYQGFIPLWDTVTLPSGQQVTGMMVFELPTGDRVKEFRWVATDSMIVRYPK